MVGRNLGDHLLPVHRCRRLPLGRSWCRWLCCLPGCLAVWCQQLVEQRHWRARADSGAGAQRLFPAGLEGCVELVQHPVRCVGVQAAYPGHLVAEPLLGEDLGDPVFGHPGLVTQAVRGQAELDRKPAGKRNVLRDGRDPPTSGPHIADRRGARSGVGRCSHLRLSCRADAWLGGWPGGDGDALPGGYVGDDHACGAAWCGFVPSVAGGAEHAAGVVAAPVVPAVGTKEDVQAGAAVLPGAGALLVRVVLDLAGEQLVEECGQVDGQARFPAGAAVGIILGGGKCR